MAARLTREYSLRAHPPSPFHVGFAAFLLLGAALSFTLPGPAAAWVGHDDPPPPLPGPSTSQVWLPASVFRTADGWFDVASNPRVFVADVSGDGVADLIGIASDGDIRVSVGRRTGFAADSVWSAGSIFTAPWFDATYRDRVFLTDVTGDGLVDIVGIALDGEIWVAESHGAAFGAGHDVAGSPFTTPAFFERGHQQHLWLGDVDGDHKADIVGIDSTGAVFVALATGSDTTAAFSAAEPWLPSWNCVFRTITGWFDTTSRPRVWLADVTGDGRSDLVGCDASGYIWVSESTGEGFSSSRQTLASEFQTTRDPSTNWFDAGSQPRVWVADVNGDGRDDLVGIAPAGLGDGDVWIVESTGYATTADFTQRIALRASTFQSARGWFSTAAQARVWATDVSGDRRADLIGIGSNGGVWVARSACERASPSAPAPGNGVRDFFLPSIDMGSSPLRDDGGFFSTSTQPRIWFADVTGDSVRDIVAIAPAAFGPPGVPGTSGVPGTPNQDGDVIWRPALPAIVTSVSPITRTMIDSGTEQSVTLGFSRSMSDLSAGALNVVENGVALQPTSVAAGARSASFAITFLPAAEAPLTLELSIAEGAATDLWGNPLDGEADGRSGGAFDRRYAWDSRMLLGGAKSNLTAYPPGCQGLPYPGGFGYCAGTMNEPADDDNPCRARVVVLAAAGADPSLPNTPLVLASLDLVGINTGRIHDLIEARFGIPKANVVVAATHDHAAVRNVRLFNAPFFDDREASSPDDPYEGWVEETVSGLVAQALANLTEVDVATGVATVPDLPWNRRYNNCIDQVTTDCEEQVVKFRGRGDHELRAALVHFAAHPVIMSSKMDEIDADFPGYLASRLESESNDSNPVALFFNGGAGDIIPRRAMETDSSEVAQYYGWELAAGADSVANDYVSTDGMHLSVERQVRTFAQGITSCSSCASDPPRQNNVPTPLELESTIAVAGVPGTAPAFGFMTVPGEPFVRLQLRLKQFSTVGRAMLFGYTNGYVGYLADYSAWLDPYSSYGVVACHGPTYFNNSKSPTPGEVLVTAGLESIERLSGWSGSASVSPRTALPVRFALWPNPSRSTQLAFSLPSACEVDLSIFDLGGRRVRTLASGPCAAGAYARAWDGRDGQGNPAPAGVYFYRLRAGATTRTLRGVHLR